MNGKVVVLADPNGGGYDFARQVYEVARDSYGEHVGFSFRDVLMERFPDGEILPKVTCNVRGKSCFFVQDSTMDAQDWAMSLVFVNDALRRSSAEKIHDICPYMRYMRQDRIVNGRTPISASVLASMIEMGSDGVLSTNIHNPATTGAYKIPFDNLKSHPVICDYISSKYPDRLTNLVVVAPDVGSAEIAKSYAKRIGSDVAIAYKRRGKNGEIKEMRIIGDVEEKDALLVDDMFGTAGTICTAAETLKANGARNVWAAATHGVFSEGAFERMEASPLEKVFVTDSIPRNDLPSKMEVVSLVGLFGEAIGRISTGASVSELFD